MVWGTSRRWHLRGVVGGSVRDGEILNMYKGPKDKVDVEV